MGSYVYAKRAKKNGDHIIGMFSLESLAYYRQPAKSQKYPFPYHYFYPNTGNFIGFVANLRSHDLLKKAIHAFRNEAQLPSEGVASPGWIIGVSWSDQWSFWKMSYPAIMITDTALFRNPHYHTQSDKADTLDYHSLTHLVTGLAKMIDQLVIFFILYFLVDFCAVT